MPFKLFLPQPKYDDSLHAQRARQIQDRNLQLDARERRFAIREAKAAKRESQLKDTGESFNRHVARELTRLTRRVDKMITGATNGASVNNDLASRAGATASAHE